jgi:3-deoxy-D-manno-octulosonic-acid transferase
MFFLYSLIYGIALIFIFPFEYLKRPKDLRKRWLKEKLGFFNFNFQTFSPPYPPLAKGGNGGVVWVHAVSVGEVMAALPFLKCLKKRYPSKRIILSTITDTGQKIAKESAPEGTITVYLPFDISLILQTVLKKTRPEILIVIETELWPNIFRVFKKNGIPIILLNGRISENSFKGYNKISFFMKNVLSYVDFFGMQNLDYAERIISFGIDNSKVTDLGNFKFDTKPPSQIPDWAKKFEGSIIVAGSTHEGEEELITSAYTDLKKDFQDLNLIMAPRHPERFNQVEDMIKSKRMNFIKRSEIFRLSNEKNHLSGTIILLDSIGELSSIYGIATIAVIGKSFKGYGGQNPLEPAYWGKPIVCGPHMENFLIIKDFYAENAALEVKNNELYPKLKELLMSPEKAKKMGQKAQQLYRKNAGAVERAMHILERYLS